MCSQLQPLLSLFFECVTLYHSQGLGLSEQGDEQQVRTFNTLLHGIEALTALHKVTSGRRGGDAAIVVMCPGQTSGTGMS